MSELTPTVTQADRNLMSVGPATPEFTIPVIRLSLDSVDAPAKSISIINAGRRHHKQNGRQAVNCNRGQNGTNFRFIT